MPKPLRRDEVETRSLMNELLNMLPSEFIGVMTSMMTVMLLMVAVVFARQWVRRQEQFRQEELELRRMELEVAAGAKQAINIDLGKRDEPTRPGNGGYIVIDLPDDQKAMFQDVLKGFEEFSKIKGYSISFSVDGSVPDKIAFKFTILDTGVTVSTARVKEDLKDYVRRVQSGDDLSDLEVVVPDPEHAALILALRNRISYLDHTYKMQKNALEFYERILKTGTPSQLGITPTQQFYITGAGDMNSKSYTAIGSSRVVQGDNNEVDQSIHIAESFNEKKQQLENLDQLIAALTAAHSTPTEDSKKAIINLEKVKDELKTEDKPDATRIMKWMDTAKSAIKVLALGKDALDLAEKTFGGFHLPF